ncbi:MAG: glycosyltransferase [Solirubrobacteraceae bacterium]|nr:glycosyltransferase [Solirubrobacteraceae bacterium]
MTVSPARAGAGAAEALDVTVVIPVYNERPEFLEATLRGLAETAREAGRDPLPVILVDDGSTIPVAEQIDPAAHPGLAITVDREANAGRLRARARGLSRVETPWVWLIDARIAVEPRALAYVSESVARDPAREVFNGHVHVRTEGKPFGRFWKAITEAAWHRYFARPRELSYGLEDFDHYPKGTGMFLTRTELLREAGAAFSSVLSDERLVSDDTALIRGLASRRIWLSPEFACSYEPRTDARAFLGQVYYRGTTFYDGFAREGTRFKPLLDVFPFVSVGALVAVVVRPKLALASLSLPVITAAFAKFRRVGTADTAVLAGLSLPFAAVYSLGIWRGVLLARFGGKPSSQEPTT